MGARIAIVGTGAVGGYAGAHMAKAGEDVVFVDFWPENVETIRKWLEAEATNIHPVGRNGMHKYNNQDHSMYTAMLTVENMYGASHDIWSVNVEEEYHETGSTGRDAPVLPRREAVASVLDTG